MIEGGDRTKLSGVSVIFGCREIAPRVIMESIKNYGSQNVIVFFFGMLDAVLVNNSNWCGCWSNFIGNVRCNRSFDL